MGTKKEKGVYARSKTIIGRKVKWESQGSSWFLGKRSTAQAVSKTSVSSKVDSEDLESKECIKRFLLATSRETSQTRVRRNQSDRAVSYTVIGYKAFLKVIKDDLLHEPH
jgi:hypothetical protein